MMGGRSRSRIRNGVLTLCGAALVATLTPVVGASQPAPPSPALRLAIAEMEGVLSKDISPEEIEMARQALAPRAISDSFAADYLRQAEAAGVLERGAPLVIGGFYAGLEIIIDEAQPAVELSISHDAPAQLQEQLTALPTEFRLRTVDASLAELRALHHTITAEAADLAAHGVEVVIVSESIEDNQVVVEVNGDVAAARQVLLRWFPAQAELLTVA